MIKQLKIIKKRAPQYGNKRSKALNATKRKWNYNLQCVNVKLANKTIRCRISVRDKRMLQKKGLIV